MLLFFNSKTVPRKKLLN